MGNTCLHRFDNQKQKVIKINGYPKLNCPNKLILEPSIQNITQNLDTFEEDFFKSEFQFDIQSDNQKNYSPSRVKLGSSIEQINKSEQIECPSHFNEIYDFQQDNQLKQFMNPNNNNKNVFIQGQKTNHQKKIKQKVSLQKIEKPKSILKTHKKQHNSSFNSFQCTKCQHTVTFSLATCNSRNSRSLSPLLNSLQVDFQPVNSRSMTYLQQFPYL
ncbi:unnamed protein product [Paramecium primaurelia]|uniref:Uncharacterized protein n=1 Tax=Paramecium primaurelia TaxID=5886 RepID=A0A8S1KAU7_PARPR|nr:unnamed protein product [Paramecium primaurelia]